MYRLCREVRAGAVTRVSVWRSRTSRMALPPMRRTKRLVVTCVVIPITGDCHLQPPVLPLVILHHHRDKQIAS
jgi:hypothetical protein